MHFLLLLCGMVYVRMVGIVLNSKTNKATHVYGKYVLCGGIDWKFFIVTVLIIGIMYNGLCLMHELIQL